MDEKVSLLFELLHQPGNFSLVVVAVLAVVAILSIAAVVVFLSKRSASFERQTKTSKTSFSTKHTE